MINRTIDNYASIIHKFQKSEITEHFVYKYLAKLVKDKHNKKILTQISKDELRHYNFWKSHSNIDIEPSKCKIFFYKYLAKIFGLTFVVKLMENGEAQAQINYDKFIGEIDDIEQVIEDENTHEQALISVLKEKKLDYMGSIVLGLNDALVELTGVLAGLTLVLQDMKLIALSGLITGIAASFSMGVSEYLSKKTDGEGDTALTASIYTRIAYLITVVLLILPYLLLQNPFVALAISLMIAMFIIGIFNFYVSVAKGFNFKKRFVEMAVLSLGVAVLSFGVARILRLVFNINV